MTKRNNVLATLLLIVIGILFLIVVKDYIIPVVIAALVAGMLQPFYGKLLKKLKGKRILSAVITTILFLLTIIIPSIFLIILVYKQAVSVSQSLPVLLENQMSNTDALNQSLPEWFPFKGQLEPYKTEIYTKIGELTSLLGNVFVEGLSSFAQGTLVFFINLFTMLYALYYFLSEKEMLNKMVLKYTPFTKQQTQDLIKKIISISRATIKGALLIGMVQGALVGLAFWVAGIGDPLFWGTLAAIASLIPSVGSAMIYVPASIYLMLTGNTTAGIGVLVWGFLVVSNIDNILRPVLVGSDTEMSDLMVLISTLGGITLFGLSGFILGPVIAGLTTSIVEIYYDSTSE